MALQISIKIIGIGASVTSARYEIKQFGTILVLEGLINIPANGELIIPVSESPLALNELVSIHVDNFTGDNSSIARSCFGWAYVENNTLTDFTAPSMIDQSFNFNEGRATGDMIATVAASDNIGITAFVFTATGTNLTDDGFFSIDTNGAITLTAAGEISACNDFGTLPNTYIYSVTASDAAGNVTTADITLNTTEVINGVPLSYSIVDNVVSFINPVAVTGTWDFGDNYTTTDINPTHEYNQHGTYAFTLNGVDETVITIASHDLVIGDFTYETDPINPGLLTFTATGAGADTYLWSIDGNTFTTSIVTYEFPSSGTYIVTCEVSNAYGNASFISQSINVLLANQLPIGDFTYSKAKLIVSFDSTGITDEGTIETYSWIFGDGTTSTLANPVHTYPDPAVFGDPLGQNFTVSLTVTDDRGGQLALSKIITVYDVYSDNDLGAELMLNPTFDTTDLSDFSTTTTVSMDLNSIPGALTIVSLDGAQDRADLIKNVVIGKRYRVLITAQNTIGLTAKLKNWEGIDRVVDVIISPTAMTSYEVEFIATATTFTGRVYASGTGAINDTVVIEELSLKEIL